MMFVGNMMLSVVLDGNTLDRELSLNGNLLDELVKRCKFDVSIVSTECNDGRIVSMCQSMMKRVCLKAYADLSSRSRVCTR